MCTDLQVHPKVNHGPLYALPHVLLLVGDDNQQNDHHHRQALGQQHRHHHPHVLHQHHHRHPHHVAHLLQDEHVVVEELLQLLVAEVDRQLLEPVEVEDLKASNVQNTYIEKTIDEKKFIK